MAEMRGDSTMGCRWRVIVVLWLMVGFVSCAPAGDEKSIALEEGGRYLGGIDRTWKLTIGGPKERHWEYRFEHSPAGTGLPDISARGTYERIGDLVRFTGKTGKGEVCFAFNLGFPGGNIEFNAFFPEGDKALRYRRQWFSQRAGKWTAAEEVILSIPRQGPAADRWIVPVKGERIQWDASGKETREKIDRTLAYQKRADGLLYELAGQAPARVPRQLSPKEVGGSLEAVLLYSNDAAPFGIVRGFFLPVGDWEDLP
jgi:hypothetical protein